MSQRQANMAALRAVRTAGHELSIEQSLAVGKPSAHDSPPFLRPMSGVRTRATAVVLQPPRWNR